MPQISLYVDEPTQKKIESAAREQHVSISTWVARQLRSRLEANYPPASAKEFSGLRPFEIVPFEVRMTYTYYENSRRSRVLLLLSGAARRHEEVCVSQRRLNGQVYRDC